MSRAERNKRLKKTMRGGDVSQLIPEGFDPYQRTYICTHWLKKHTKITQGRKLALTAHPFDRLSILARYPVEHGARRASSEKQCFVQNHRVSPAALSTYPTSRGVVDPLVGARVHGMVSVGAKRSRIYDYLLKHDQNVIQVDVDNLVRDHGSSVSGLDDNDAMDRKIALFAASDPEMYLRYQKRMLVKVEVYRL